MAKTFKPLDIHPEAQMEASISFGWYQYRSPDAAERFKAALGFAFEKIEQTPGAFPEYLAGTRRILLEKFPYLVVFCEMPDRWLVVAVAHGRRKPGYWRRRLK